ncbi:hypothetical protein [Actinoplanes sp. G11-F43]|uniref:hypothetical protein n=1 Tax=Actinoplanes sp. G11-F43 TaxID=3424130 RepID=UPI003D3567E9
MRRLITLLAMTALAAGGCAGTASPDGAPDGRNENGAPAASGPAGPQAGLTVLRVLADESLEQIFPEIEQGFEVLNPNIEVLPAYAKGPDLTRTAASGEKPALLVTDDPIAPLAAGRTSEKIGRLIVVTLDEADGAAATFTDFLREGDGKRILIDSGLLRP